MTVFATLFGKLAQSMASSKDARVQLGENPPGIGEILGSHTGMVPNPLSKRSKHLEPRIQDAQVFRSVCPYCAVGCGQLIYVKDQKVIGIEGDPDSPVSQGCLCPKGLAGGSFLISTLAHLLDFRQEESIVRTGRYISFVSILISPILLIKVLGRPERFLHMLRVLKFRSVMSIGTWAVSIFALFCSLATAHQAAKDGLLNWFPWMSKLMKALPIKFIESIGALIGIVVASYTGVLLAATAVPVWARARTILGALFFTSGLSTSLAAISFFLSLDRHKRHQNSLESLEQAEIIASVTELGLISALVPILGPLGKPLFKGRDGMLLLGGTVGAGLMAPLLLRLGWKITRQATPRTVNIFTSIAYSDRWTHSALCLD